MKPATASDDNGAFSAQKSIFEFALRARKITIIGALATQFHEICGLGGGQEDTIALWSI
ncbi:MAG: hypothetical protein ACK5GN_03215 [Pseudomonadota bacterium]|jgi:hypothetical protein